MAETVVSAITDSLAPRARALVARLDALDRAMVRALPRIRRRALTPVLVAVTYSGSGPVWFASATVLASLTSVGIGDERAIRIWLACMTGSLASLVTGQLLKRGFRRTRPFDALEGHETLGLRPRDASMPSTHSSTATALAVGLALAGSPWAPLVAIWAAAVVFSRYYTGVHYPSDLAAGVLLGGAFGIVDYSGVVRVLLGAPRLV
ncbi:MAG: phosphatase PAP2 family protein [Deltaproteobacteria bacterium]|nr:phosphatase PAP2 family protein [Deltaproteobacteria bacterium]